MNIIQDTAIELYVRDFSRLQTAIPDLRYVEKSSNGLYRVLVRWTLENVRRLSNMGVGGNRVPSPILRDYHWPGRFTPFEHQKETSSFLTANNRSYCFNSPGTGKTASVIWSADYMMEVGDISNVLIICPLSIMKVAWVDEVFSTAMHRSTAVCHGTKAKRIDIIKARYDFTIINYDGVPLVEKELKAANYDLIVIDEASAVKTATTKRWKAINRIVQPETRLWMLTGTPAAQSPVDAFGLAKMNTPQRVPKYFGSWRDKVMVRVTQFKWIPVRGATQLVHDALQPAIRYAKEDCLDLPPLTYQTRNVPLTAQQEKYYKLLKTQMRVSAAGETITAVHAAAGILKLLQISAGNSYTDSGEVVEFDASNRLKELISVIEQAEHKVIVFARFGHSIDRVTEHVRKHGYTVAVIRGSVSGVKRSQIFSDFQKKSDPHVLVVQPQSAAHGVTLTAADTIVWYSPVESVETWIQANERINRPSQDNKMTVVKLIGSDVEKNVYDVLQSKNNNQKALVDLYRSTIGLD